MSSTPTAGIAAATRSGRCVITAPTSRPPLLRPWIANCPDVVTPDSIRCSATAMKSSKTFCFRSSRPASYHSVPNSPPPRRLAMASNPPAASQPDQPGR